MKYCLFTLFDNTYFEQGTNMLFSFLQNNKWFDGDIIILCDEGEYCPLSDDKRDNIKQLYSNIYFNEVNSNEYSDLFNIQSKLANNKKWLSCFYKYEILKYNSYDKMLYLDSDIIVSDNILELFDNDIMFGTCNDFICNINNYFNGGVYIIDNKFIDKYSFKYVYDESCKLDKSFFNGVKTKGRYVDQDCLNIIINKEDITFLPMLTYCCPVDINININDFNAAKIKHYFGYNKPWIKRLGENKLNVNKFCNYINNILPKEFQNKEIQQEAQRYYSEYYFYTYWKIKDYPGLF